MSIEYKVIERANPQDRTKKKYYASANITGRTTTKEMCREVEQLSALSGAEVQGVLYTLAELLPQHLSEGKSVELEGIGTFRISLISRGEAKAEDVDMHTIEGPRIIFNPSKAFLNAMQNLRYKKIHP